MEDDQEQPEQPKTSRTRKASVACRSTIILISVLLVLVTVLVCDLFFTRPSNFKIDSAFINFASVLPTAGALINLDLRPRFSKIDLKDLTCHLESGSIFVTIEPAQAENNSQFRYKINATVAHEDLENHGNLVWETIVGNKAPELLGCLLSMTILVGYVIPVDYTYNIEDFGALKIRDDATQSASGASGVQVSTTVSQKTLLLTLQLKLDVPGSFPIRMNLPAANLTAGTTSTSSRKIMVSFEGADITDMANSDPMLLSVTCEGGCAWYNPIIDIALGSEGSVEVAIQAGQSFLEYVAGRHHEVSMTKRKKHIDGRHLDGIDDLTCFEISTSGAFAYFCTALHLSDGLVVDAEFEAFGSKGKANGELRWSEPEKDTVLISTRSTASLNEDDKIDLVGEARIHISDFFEISASVTNGCDWPFEASLLSSTVWNDEVFSIKVNKLYARWKEDSVANAEAEFKLNFSEGSLKLYFVNEASDWPIQFRSSGKASLEDNVFNSNLDQLQLIWRQNVLLETVGSIYINFDDSTLLVSTSDPSFSGSLSGRLGKDTMTTSLNLAFYGWPTLRASSVGFANDLDDEGFQFGVISTPTLNNEKELDLSINLFSLSDAWNIDMNLSNTVGPWPMDFMLRGGTPSVPNGFQLFIDTIFLRVHDRTILDTSVKLGIDFGTDFDLTFIMTDPSFSVSANTRINVANSTELSKSDDYLVRGIFVLEIDEVVIVQFSFDGMIVNSNFRNDYNGTFGRDGMTIFLEELLFVFKGKTYLNAVGSVDLDFDNNFARFFLENTAHVSNFVAASDISWTLRQGLAKSLEVKISRAWMEMTDETLFDVVGFVRVSENAEDTISGEIELVTDNDAARVEASTILMFQFVPSSFLLDAKVLQGKISFDDNDYVDWEIELSVQDRDEFFGELICVSDNPNAFLQVNGLFTFVLDDSYTARFDEPLSIIVDSKEYINVNSDLLLSSNSISFHVMEEISKLAMSIDHGTVNSRNSDFNVTMDGIFLKIPGHSPFVDGGMMVVLDGDRLELHVNNNTTQLVVDKTVTVDFDSNDFNIK